MKLTAVLLFAGLGIPVAAYSAYVLRRIEPGWSARQRVFNSAAIFPVLLAVGSVCFATIILTSGAEGWITGSNAFQLQTLTAIFAAYGAGLLAAYVMETLLDR